MNILKPVNALLSATMVCFLWSCESTNQDQTASVHQPYPFDYDKSMKPFYQGVASGDPLPESVILWTRVTPEYEDTISVNWSIYSDQDLQDKVKGGSVSTHSGKDYTVKVDVDGLKPGTHYYYQFEVDEAKSLVGRTKTAAMDPEDVSLAFASCSHFEKGYFSAYRKISEIDSLDAVVHLGDYIYEYAPRDSSLNRIHYPPVEIKTLDDYRGRYAQYRTDPDLIKAHQMHPWITIWDDHEITNNAYIDGAQNHQPETEGDYGERKAAARQAYYEYLPVRNNQEQALYRDFSWGDLVDIFMLDGRLAGRSMQLDSMQHPDYLDSSRSMLGEKQLNWLLNNLTESDAKWKILGNQVIFAGVDLSRIFPGRTRSMDQWDGYPVERQKILNAIEDNQVDNFLVVTGDFHSSLGLEVYKEPLDLSGYPNGVLGVEYVVQSVTSSNLNEGRSEEEVAKVRQAYLNGPDNPHVKYANLSDHGYFLLHLNQDQALGQWVYMDRIDQPETGQKIKQQYLVNDGETGFKPVDASAW